MLQNYACLIQGALISGGFKFIIMRTKKKKKKGKDVTDVTAVVIDSQ